MRPSVCQVRTVIFWTGFYRYLSDLHAPGDPAWQCIGAQHQWILQLMHNCKESYVKEQKGKDTFLFHLYISMYIWHLGIWHWLLFDFSVQRIF